MQTLLAFVLSAAGGLSHESAPGSSELPCFSGIYPHLAFFNDEGECGVGAVVPWAGRLWAITYAPHKPRGSSDKLYEIDDELRLTIRPESVGGTPANRMIHRESKQLFMGPYVIDAERNVRTIPYSEMFGRPTGNARHLTDPEGKVYVATMEEGLYEVDVDTLEVTTLFHDEQVDGSPKADLPGYHGKGLYSGGGRLVYSNNGEHGSAARRDPFVESGVLAEWDGAADAFTLVERRQFTEVTGPGGIHGPADPQHDPHNDPVWSIGWDAKSLILMCLHQGEWHRYRLPKASHSYDGAHGWNTEWPRIREVGEGDDLLMTMHGMFWRFPRTFTPATSGGIRPRSSYLKVVGDFCRWGDRIVLGCDDAARSEFLNRRRAKGEVAGPQSQSNLWFVRPEEIDSLGPVLGRGAVWLREPVATDAASDPFHLAGAAGGSRGLHLDTDRSTKISLEADADGTGDWSVVDEWPVDGYRWIGLQHIDAEWVRLRSSESLANATAWFTLKGRDDRAAGRASSTWAGVARVGEVDNSGRSSGGVVRARGGNKRTLHLACDEGYYELSADARLQRVDDPAAEAWLRENAAVPAREGVVSVDAASVLYVHDSGARWRLPVGHLSQGEPRGRLCREVATERDLFNVAGTFYELPAENAGGFAKVRPISTHDLQVDDFCSYRGLLVLSGVEVGGDSPKNEHLVRSNDGRTGLWLGAVDDLWSLGKPVGDGGPWLATAVKAGEASDPYLMTGYDVKSLELTSSAPVQVTCEVDVTGMGVWHSYRTFDVGKRPVLYRFPPAFEAYWVRFRSNTSAEVTAQLSYR
ncbi:MAG: hypothetical protein AAGG01_04045 [Planctomycetota bacterium]